MSFFFTGAMGSTSIVFELSWRKWLLMATIGSFKQLMAE